MIQENLSKDGIKTEITKQVVWNAVFSVLFSLFAVVFMWGFWQKGAGAMGLNFFIFATAFFSLIIYKLAKEKNYTHRDLFWLIPFSFIILSFFLYNNLFTKNINFFVMPFLFAFFFTFSFMDGKKEKPWNSAFIFKILERIIFFFDKINDSCAYYFKLIKIKKEGKNTLFLRILLGIFFFTIIAGGIILPLLSSVDPIFAGKVDYIYKHFLDIFTPSLMGKLVFFIVLSVIFLALMLAWWKKYSWEEKIVEKENKTDGVIITIIIGGIFLIYALFIGIQFKRLWLGNLPINFSETVNLVKSGFWQLFFLSVVNVLIFLSFFRKINKAFQILLGFFTVSSLLLLFSSAWRMYLYAYNYGLSYEKFYASYTVIFSFLVFAVLLLSFAFKKKFNFLKIFALTFIWLYSLTTIIPLEHFILSANLELKTKPDSRIRIAELTMLSPDVLGEVEKKILPGKVDEEMWQNWIKYSRGKISAKKWYEMCLLDFGKK